MLGRIRRYALIVATTIAVAALFGVITWVLGRAFAVPAAQALEVTAAIAIAAATVIYVGLTARLVTAAAASADVAARTQRRSSLTFLDLKSIQVDQYKAGDHAGDHYVRAVVRNSLPQHALQVRLSVTSTDSSGASFDVDYDPRPALGPSESQEWGWRVGGVPWEKMYVTIEHDGLLGGRLTQQYSVVGTDRIILMATTIRDDA